MPCPNNPFLNDLVDDYQYIACMKVEFGAIQIQVVKNVTISQFPNLCFFPKEKFIILSLQMDIPSHQGKMPNLFEILHLYQMLSDAHWHRSTWRDCGGNEHSKWQS